MTYAKGTQNACHALPSKAVSEEDVVNMLKITSCMWNELMLKSRIRGQVKASTYV